MKHYFRTWFRRLWADHGQPMLAGQTTLVGLAFVLNFLKGRRGKLRRSWRRKTPETFLSEISVRRPFKERTMSMESLYELRFSFLAFGAYSNEFERRGLTANVFAIADRIGTAIQTWPKAFVEGKHEIVCHGLKWIHLPRHVHSRKERQHMTEPSLLSKKVTWRSNQRLVTQAVTRQTRAPWLRTHELNTDSRQTMATTYLMGWKSPIQGCKSNQPHLYRAIYTWLQWHEIFSSPYGSTMRKNFFQIWKDNFDCLVWRRRHCTKMMSIGACNW